MAKRKPAPTIESVLSAFRSLSLDDQQALVARLPYWAVSHHPILRRKLRDDKERQKQNNAADVEFVKALIKSKVPRNEGKVERLQLAQHLKAEGLSHGQIGQNSEFVKLNGKRMSARDVGKFLAYHRKKRKS